MRHTQGCHGLLAWSRWARHTTSRSGGTTARVFFSDSDRQVYMAFLAERCRKFALTLLGYCLIPKTTFIWSPCPLSDIRSLSGSDDSGMTRMTEVESKIAMPRKDRTPRSLGRFRDFASKPSDQFALRACLPLAGIHSK